MKKVPLDLVKDLRRRSQAGISDCKQALEESGGDIEEAVRLLRKRGLEIARAKKERAVHEGRIECYVHPGNKLGVILEVNCETDFVARGEDFSRFTKDLAMQIAASNPPYIRKEDIPAGVIEKVDNKEEFYKQNCLLEQVFIKDLSITINDYLTDIIGKIGENIVIHRFARYKLGEE
ncbi:MAG: elongation factor Ts [Candidatus Omnitrophota bacterium]